MDILSIINQEHYLKKFGMIIRMLRTRHRYTLRSLASQVGLSHAYLRKIEMAQTTINKNVYDRLMSVFNMYITYDEAIETKFFEAWKHFNQSIIYLNKGGIEEAFRTIEEDKAIHNHSFWMIEYYIMLLGYKKQDLDKNMTDLSQLHDDLTSIETLLDDTTKQLYYIYVGNYYYHMNNAQKNREAFEKIIAMNTWNVYTAMALYLLGLSYTMTFSLKRSNRYLWEAHGMFKKMNIDVRVNTIRVFIEMNLMKMGIQDKTEQIFDFGYQISNDHQLPEFTRLINYNYAVYFLKNNKPTLALEKLDAIDIATYQLYLYKAQAYSLLTNDAKVIETIDEALNAPIKLGIANIVYYYGLHVLKAYHANDDRGMKEHVQPFFEECLRHAAYYEIDIAYQYYKQYLISHRRYKDAYELSRQMISLTKNAFD